MEIRLKLWQLGEYHIDVVIAQMSIQITLASPEAADWWWVIITILYPDSKDHGANMGPIWGRQDPGGPHVGPMNFAIWGGMLHLQAYSISRFGTT